MTHAGFILVAYGLVAIVLAALVAWLVLEARSLAQRQAELEAQGVRRRSAAPRPETVRNSR